MQFSFRAPSAGPPCLTQNLGLWFYAETKFCIELFLLNNFLFKKKRDSRVRTLNLSALDRSITMPGKYIFNVYFKDKGQKMKAQQKSQKMHSALQGFEPTLTSRMSDWQHPRPLGYSEADNEISRLLKSKRKSFPTFDLPSGEQKFHCKNTTGGSNFH